MPIVRVDLSRNADKGAFENEFSAFLQGQLSADLLDDGSASTGYTLDIVNADFTGQSGGGSSALAGVGNFPELVLEEAFYNNGAAQLEIGGLTQGDNFTLELTGHAGTQNRDTDFTVTPANEGTQRYDASGDPAAPNAAVVFTGTVGAAGTINIAGAVVSVFWYLNGFYLDVQTGGPAKTASVRLADLNGNDRANVATVPWRWYDGLPIAGLGPTDTGTGSTDSSGNMTVDIPNSTLTAGQVGYLLIDTGSWQSIHAVTVTEI